MEPKYITFEQAKWFKEKGYEIDTDEVLFCRDEINNIEEHQIKNRDVIYNVGILYMVDENEYRVYEQHQVVDWLLEKHGIWITVTSISQESWQWHITKPGDSLGKLYQEDFYSPQEAYSAAFDYIKNNNLI